jgi:hypothetical protein
MGEMGEKGRMAAAAGEETAALLASQQQRDEDANDSLDPKTRKQYEAVMGKTFYEWAKANGRSAVVRQPAAGEALSMRLINDECFRDNETDIITCFLSAVARRPDGGLWGISKQQGARSAMVYYLKQQVPPRKMSVATDVAVKRGTQAHKRHIVGARALGAFKVR